MVAISAITGTLAKATGTLSKALPFIGSFGSGIFGSTSSAKSAKKQYQYNLELQRQAQTWAEYMSSTAHQREVRDLRAAGLNPILSATGGNGASAAAIGANSVNAPDYNQGFANALAYKQLKNETELKNSSIDMNESQKGVNQTIKWLNRSLERKALYEGDAAHAQGWYQTELTRQLEEYGPLKFQAEINSILANTAKTYQDMKNSTELIRSQIRNLNSNSAKSNKETSAIYQPHFAGVNAGKFGRVGLEWNEYDF